MILWSYWQLQLLIKNFTAYISWLWAIFLIFFFISYEFNIYSFMNVFHCFTKYAIHKFGKVFLKWFFLLEFFLVLKSIYCFNYGDQLNVILNEFFFNFNPKISILVIGKRLLVWEQKKKKKTGKGMLLGKISPFKKVPLLEAIL